MGLWACETGEHHLAIPIVVKNCLKGLKRLSLNAALSVDGGLSPIALSRLAVDIQHGLCGLLEEISVLGGNALRLVGDVFD